MTAFSLTFQKKLFAYKGKKHGYLLAKCADGHFDAQAEAIFTDGTKLGGKIVRVLHAEGLRAMGEAEVIRHFSRTGGSGKAADALCPLRVSAGRARPSLSALGKGGLPVSSRYRRRH